MFIVLRVRVRIIKNCGKFSVIWSERRDNKLSFVYSNFVPNNWFLNINVENWIKLLRLAEISVQLMWKIYHLWIHVTKANYKNNIFPLQSIWNGIHSFANISDVSFIPQGSI